MRMECPLGCPVFPCFNAADFSESEVQHVLEGEFLGVM
jgi:hypothetical protein